MKAWLGEGKVGLRKSWVEDGMGKEKLGEEVDVKKDGATSRRTKSTRGGWRKQKSARKVDTDKLRRKKTEQKVDAQSRCRKLT